MSVETSVPVAPQVDFLSSNLTALAKAQPRTHRVLAQAEPPGATDFVTARDDSLTIGWKEHGRTCYLGRSTMPRVRAEALIESFQPGLGNVLLHGFGTGHEAALLLSRLLPHQAVFVLEPEAWLAKQALRLHDLCAPIRDGRLLIFAGPEALESMRAFLIDEAGYLCPERVLAWPWFDEATAREIGRSLTDLSQSVAACRASRNHVAVRGDSGEPSAGTIAVVSPMASTGVRELARHLGDAAASLRIGCERYALESPRDVQPQAVEARLARLAPRIVLILDAVPSRLSYRLPAGSQVVVPVQGEPPAPAWWSELGETAYLAARSGAQARAAIASGVARERILPWPDAASNRLDDTERAPRGDGFLVVTDIPPSDAEAAGLTLTSHQHVWRVAGQILADRGDAFAEAAAPRLLDEAARILKIELKSEAVRAGLIERFRHILIPARRQARTLARLEHVGVAFRRFDLRGESARDTGDLLTRMLHSDVDGVGLLLYLTGGALPPKTLPDAAAAGIPLIAHRADWLDEPDADYRLLESPDQIAAYRTDDELLHLLTAYRRDPAAWQARAEAARQHLRTYHTWPRRLETLLSRMKATVGE